MGFFDLFKKKQNTQPTTPAERSQPTSPENHRPAAVENTTKQENTSPQPAARTADREQAELNSGLEKTKTGLFSKLARAVAGRSTIDTQVLDDLEEVLITSDVGVETTVKIIERIEARVARDKYMNTSELQSILRDEIAQLMEESHRSTENFGLDVEEGVPLRHHGRRRERRRQDHDDRQTRGPAHPGRPQRLYRRCGYVPCGRHRPVGRMGRTGRRHDDPSGDGLRSGVGGLRHLEIGRGEQGRRRTDRHGGPPAQQGRPDERADQDPQRDGQGYPPTPRRR